MDLKPVAVNQTTAEMSSWNEINETYFSDSNSKNFLFCYKKLSKTNTI